MEQCTEQTDGIDTIPNKNSLRVKIKRSFTPEDYDTTLRSFRNYCIAEEDRYLQEINHHLMLDVIFACVNDRGITGLMLSIIHQTTKAFNLILDTIQTSITTGGYNVERISSYLNSFNVYGHNALHMSLFVRNKEMVQRLIGIGCNPLAMDSKLRNVFHHIAYENIRSFTETVHKILLQKYGKNANKIENVLLTSKDAEGMTPVHVAIQYHKQVNLLKEFLNPSGNFEIENPEERELRDECLMELTGKCHSSVLHLAAAAGDEQTMSYLIHRIPIMKRDEFVNLQNGSGFTALLIAESWNHSECARVLIRNGAIHNQWNGEEEY